MNVRGLPVILPALSRKKLRWDPRFGFDRIVAALGLLLVGPLMLLVALAILIESGRPVFFSQWRLGRDGKLFRLHKFRKFRARELSNSRPLTIRGDDRMTRVGRFIERTKIDELPQLWDVLRGAMSLVGPRPEVPDFADCYAGRYAALLRWRPGIFGPAQMAFRNEADLYPPGENPLAFYRHTLFPAKAELDLGYYPRRSLAADLLWIVRCLAAIAGLGRRRRHASAASLSPGVAAASRRPA